MNKTEESWSRRDIKNAKPSENSDEILERINKITPTDMSYDAAVDFFTMQLSSWRRFYKEDDKVQVDEAFTADNKRVSQIKSRNIVYYVVEMNEREIKIRNGFYDTIKTSYKKLFEDLDNGIEMLEGAK